MGKAKPVSKKAVQQSSHMKISTSLFQRKSKTSQGAGLVEGISSMKALKKAAGKSSATTTPKSKQGKSKESNSGTTANKALSNKSKGGKDASSSASTTTPKKGTAAKQKGTLAGKKSQEKRPPSPVVEPKGGKSKEKAGSNANTKKGKVIVGKAGKGTPTVSKGKAAPQKKRFSSSSSSSASSSTSTTSSSSSSSSPSSSDGEKSTRTNSTAKKKVAVHKRKSRDSREDASPSPTTRLRSPDSEKVTTRKRYKSDSESPPPQKVAKVGEKKNTVTKNKKGAAQSKSTGTTKNVVRKVGKKAVASIVASKKKTVVKKPEKSSTSTKPASSSGKAKESSSSTAPSKDKKKKPEIASSSTSVKSKPSKVVKVKPKAKPRTKIKVKRMASLNAKAILEASFSFEPSEKKQRSPAPQSSSSTSISTSTSTTPQNKSKATASTSTSTDELTSKGATGGGSAVQDIKPSTSSSSSSSTLTSSTGTSTSSKGKEASPSPKKKKDVAVVAVCSVSTSTSPTPPEIPEPKTFKSNPVSVKSEKKQRKSTDQASSGSSTAGGASAVASRRESISSTKSSSRDTQTTTISPSNSPISVGTSCTQTSGTSGSSGTPLSKKKEKSSADAATQGKAGSRRSSTAASSTPTNSSTDTSTSTGKSKEKGAKSPNPKKKQKMVATATTTSTSTSTSPIPTMWNECDVASEKRAVAIQPATTASVPKQKKKRSESSGGKDKVQQDSSSQVQQGQLPSHQHSTSTSSKHKSASYQTKEKSSTPVALYGSGTVYQPAGPLIEPHKQSSVPAGILPETVRLPPDLKVTYQTHPPSSAFMVSSPSESQQQHQHHHHHHHHHSSSTTAAKSSGGSSSSKSYKSSSSSHKSSEKSSSSSSAGTILHQPYKSTPSAASSPSLSRNVPSGFSSAGSGYASSSGTPLLSPSEQSTLLSHHHHQQQHQTSSASAASALHGSHHQQGSSGSISAHPLHSVTPGGSITLGGSAAQHAQTQNPGAPSSAGLFYTTTNYGHSPFAQVKYPIVPPESYRTQSPFQNSFLCPPTTPQPSQSYFMTPFYTPPLTPNPTPGMGTVGPNQGRPLSALTAAAAHHPSAAAAAAAAAAAYYQQGGALSQQPPAPYYMPSPQHHSIHPSPAAPGHAGPFRPNQSSQPACPFPTESYQPSSNCTNNNIRPPPLQQRPSLSSGSLPAPEAGAKQPKPKSSTSPALVSVTASRPSRNNKETLFHHPPICTTPAVAADPPSSIQIMPVSTNTITGGDARQQLESAKTFTEQYSLPDDITITPILPPNPPPQLNPALLMLNSSVSVMLTSAPSTTTTTLTTTTSKSTSGTHDGLLKTNNSFNHMPSKPKEKDIVHVIDPRSGQRTTIAKHISNNSRIAGNLSDINKNRTKIGRDSTNFAGSVGGVGKGPGITQQRTSNSRMETVRKLNPDLDVIVINNSGGDMHGNRNDKTENIQTMNLSSMGSSPATNLPEKPPRSMTGSHQGNPIKTMPPLKAGGRMAPNKTHPVPFSAISSSVMGIAPSSSSHHQQGKRVALAHSDNNNFQRNNSGNNNANTSANSILRVNQKKSKGQRNSLPNTSNFPQQSVYPHMIRSPPSSTASVSSQLPHNHNQYAIPSLPPGISISAGSSSAMDNMQPTNLSKKNYGNVMTSYRQPQQQAPVNMTYHQPKQKNVKAIKRSLNECIDGLQLQHQQKKLKLLEQQHAIISNGNNRAHNMGNGNPLSASTSARTGIFNVNGGKPIFSGTVSPQQQQVLFQQQQQQFRQHQQQFVAGNLSNKLARQQQQQFLQTPIFGTETATAARVRGPAFEQKVGGGMVINSSDAMTAVSALVVEPFDYSLAGRQQAYNAIIHNNGLASRARKEKAVGGRPIVASSYQAYTEAKKKVNKLKGRQHMGEKVSLSGGTGGRGAVAGGGAGGAKSKIRTRLSVKPKGLHHNTQQPLGSRSRSRLLRKRSLLCNPNSNNNSGNRKSESDGGSVCASRSSSSVRIISGGTAQQNGGKGGKERERERPKHTQAFINATADLYQYRRRLILRVPSPKPVGVNSSSVSSSATAVSNLNRAIPMGADAIARFGDSSSSPSSSLPVEVASTTKSEIPRELAAHQMHQIAFSHIVGNQHQSPMSLAVQESKGPSLSPLPRTGSMVVNAMKKRAGMKPLSPASVNGALTQQLLLNSKRQPRWSNGWTFEGEPYEAKVYVKNDDMPITRRCYPSMRHDGGDVIRTRDCVLLKSGPRKNDLPFIAKIAALWENPADGEMMFSLLWYYRPEHTELGRTKDDMMDEIFASKHRDTNSVATIEDRCYVLTFNEYCRYRKRLKQLEQGIQGATMVPFADTAMINTDAAAKIAESVWSGKSVDSSSSLSSSSSSSKSSTFQGKVSPEVIFFCRKVYDFRQKRILKNPS